MLIKKALASGHAAVGGSAGRSAHRADAGGKGDDHDNSGVRAALELALTTPGVSSVIVGTINPAHLAGNVRVAEDVGGDGNRGQGTGDRKTKPA